MNLINTHTLDPATLYSLQELEVACRRHLPGGAPPRLPAEPEATYHARLLQVPWGSECGGGTTAQQPPRGCIRDPGILP